METQKVIWYTISRVIIMDFAWNNISETTYNNYINLKQSGKIATETYIGQISVNNNCIDIVDHSCVEEYGDMLYLDVYDQASSHNGIIVYDFVDELPIPIPYSLSYDAFVKAIENILTEYFSQAKLLPQHPIEVFISSHCMAWFFFTQKKDAGRICI